MKLKDTDAKTSFEYKWLMGRIFPFIKPFMGRIILGFLVAIPVGLLDGVVAFALKPYLDYVVGQKNLVIWGGHEISYMLLATIIPFAVIFFAAFQGALKYLNEYISVWTSQKITNSIKTQLFAKLVYMDTSFYDENSSGIVISRYLSDPDTASKSVVENVKDLTTGTMGALALIIVMLHSSWKLAFIGVMVLCVAFIPAALIRKRIKKASNKNMVIGGNITTNFNETYSGNKVMTAYCLQERQKNLFKTQVQDSFDVNMSLV